MRVILEADAINPGSQKLNTTLEEIAVIVGAKIEEASKTIRITGIASVSEAEEGQLTFFGNAKYLPVLKTSKASAALVPLDFAEQTNAIPIKVANPSLAFSQVVAHFSPEPVTFEAGVHPTAILGSNVSLGKGVSIQPYAVIEKGAKIGANCVIGAHGYIGHNVTLGDDCLIHPNVTIREGTQIGNRVFIHSGSVLGSDGFGYEFSKGRYVKIPQVGIVQIDDDVEIGANVTIDRARFGRTWIQEGTKIDNLVQVAHNVVIGKHSIIISQVGISGSTKIGNYVTLAGQAGLVGHIELGDKVIVGAKSGVSKSIPAGEKWFGIPAMDSGDYLKMQARLRKLEELFQRVKKLEQPPA